jgi:hypothetical protein
MTEATEKFDVSELSLEQLIQTYEDQMMTATDLGLVDKLPDELVIIPDATVIDVLRDIITKLHQHIQDSKVAATEPAKKAKTARVIKATKPKAAGPTGEPGVAGPDAVTTTTTTKPAKTKKSKKTDPVTSTPDDDAAGDTQSMSANQQPKEDTMKKIAKKTTPAKKATKKVTAKKSKKTTVKKAARNPARTPVKGKTVAKAANTAAGRRSAKYLDTATITVLDMDRIKKYQDRPQYVAVAKCNGKTVGDWRKYNTGDFAVLGYLVKRGYIKIK